MNLEEVKPYGFIYITTNIVNRKRYIGQKMYRDGWLNYLGSGTTFKKAIKKYGRKSFVREIVAIGYSIKELDDLEVEFIKNHNAVESNEYYNLCYGGGTTKGFFPSKETKNKIRMIKTGLHLTEEVKRKIGIATKNRVIKETTRKKLSDANRRFSKEEAEEIRNKYATGSYTQKQLQKEYDTSIKTMLRIVNCQGVYANIL